MKVGDLVKHTQFGWIGLITDKTLLPNGVVLYRIYSNGTSDDYTSYRLEVLK